MRRSGKLAALIPQLYVKGLFTRDIEAALTDALEVESVSKSMVSVLCKPLHQDFKLIQKAFTAETYMAGLEQATAVVAMYLEQFPEAMKCLATELAECLTALRFPEPHRKRFYLAHLCLSWDKASQIASTSR